jgi:hypothetical protein
VIVIVPVEPVALPIYICTPAFPTGVGILIVTLVAPLATLINDLSIVKVAVAVTVVIV